MRHARKPIALAADVAVELTNRSSVALSYCADLQERTQFIIAVCSEVGAWAGGTLAGLHGEPKPPTPAETFRFIAERLEELALAKPDATAAGGENNG